MRSGFLLCPSGLLVATEGSWLCLGRILRAQRLAEGLKSGLKDHQEAREHGDLRAEKAHKGML